MNELSRFTVRVPDALFLKHLGRLYVITDDDADFKRAVDEFRKTSQVFLLCPFTLIQVKDNSDVEDPALARAIRENGASLAGILMTPLSGEPAFLMQRRGDGDLPKEAMDFVFGLSSSTREAIEHIYDSLNQEEPTAIDRILDTVTDLPVIGGLIGALSGPGEFGMVPGDSSRGRRRRADYSEAYYKAQKEFVNNVITRENTDDIEMVIQKLPPSIKQRVIHEYLMTLTDVGVREFYDKYIDMDSAARNSKVQIIVRKKTPKEKVSGTNGRYYIGYVYDGEPMVDFHFPYRTDAALYLCCLIKRKGKDGDKDLDFAAMEDLFIGAFKYLYGDVHPAATSAFGQLFDTVGESKIIAQGNLKDHLNNIRKEIDAHLLRKENTAVFHVRKGDHLHILKERITLPDNIEEAVLRLASADAEIPKA